MINSNTILSFWQELAFKALIDNDKATATTATMKNDSALACISTSLQ